MCTVPSTISQNNSQSCSISTWRAPSSWGNSSGGHIALLTALRQAAGIADVSELLNFPICGVIAESAPSDLFLCAKEGVPANMPATFRPTADLLGVSCLQEHPEKLAEASAQTYLAPDRAVPPILLLHGDRDTQGQRRA